MRRPLKSLHTLTASLDKIVTKGPVLAVQSYERIPHSDAFKVVASHNPGKFKKQQYVEAIASAFDGKFSIVESSLKRLLDGNTPVVSFIATPNTTSKPYDAESAKGMQVVTANLFMDESDNMWKVVGEGETRRLVQMSDDNLESILASREARNVVHASYQSSVEFLNGDYVLYFDPKFNEVRAGYGFLTEEGPAVLERESCEMRAVAAVQVIEAAINSDLDAEYRMKLPKFKETATLTSEMQSEHTSYMKKLYAGTDYYKSLEKLLKQKRSAHGDDEAVEMRKDV